MYNLPSEKNLIIGVIKGYDYQILQPFISTLRKTAYDGEIIFFYSNVDQKTLDKLRTLGITLLPFSEHPTISVYCLRYQLAYDFLKSNKNKYKAVMLTDTRDVIFQKNPFDFAVDDTLSCFMEQKDFKISNSPINASWIKQGFGPDAYQLLADKPIICSGITIGSTDKIIEYLEVFLNTIANYTVPTNIRGIDQGIHNFIIHSGALTSVKIWNNDDGPVLTAGLETNIRIDKKGQILNARGMAYNVVHQYDRHWPLAKKFWPKTLIWQTRFLRSKGRISTFLSKQSPTLYRFIRKIKLALSQKSRL